MAHTGLGAEMQNVSTRPRGESEYAYGGHGSGWVLFAGTMLAIVGTLNVIYGIAAVSDSRFYVRDVTYVIGDLNTWGWVLIILGAIQLVAAFSIWSGNAFGRWIGVLSAGGNAIVQMLAIPAYPFLALTIFAVDVLVIYGLIAYGGRKDLVS